MSFLKFGCKPSEQDPLLDQLHRTFSATPYLPPSTAVQPLMLVGHRGQKTKNFGPFAEMLVSTAVPFELTPEQATSADYELKRTGSFNGELGLSLLDGLFKGFNLSIDPLNGVLHREMELSLSFQKVQRLFFHHTVLGSALKNQRLDLKHPSMRPFQRDKKPLDMFITSSVLQSKAFTIHLGKKSSAGLDLDVPTVAQFTNVGLDLQGSKDTEITISHEGDKYLTFAFSCFQLSYESDGSLGIEEEVSWARGAKGTTAPADETEVNLEISFVNPRLPAIMAWDEEG